MKRHIGKIIVLRGTSNPLRDHSHDYGPALQSAVSWMGDRYLLAEPVQRRAEPSQPYFVEQRRWYPPTRH